MAMVAVSIAPSGTGSASVSDYVAAALEVVRRDGRVRWELGPMFTTLEGDLTVCLELVAKMHEALAAMGAPRIGSVIKIDDRRDKPLTMEGKMEAVRRRLENS